jgi:hypothetical protein
MSMSDATSHIQAILQPLLDHQALRAEIVEPGDSYWYHRPQRNFPPRAIQQPEDYDGGERLSLAITQTALKPPQQRALVKRWGELLPTLANVRVLWFHSKVSQEMFEAACAMPALEGLYIKWGSLTDLRPITRLRTLSHFHLGGAPSAEGLDALAALPRLIDLEIANVRAAGDLSFLRGLPQLRSLLLAGDSNSIKALKIDTLAPLAALPQLERLRLLTVQVLDGSLAPLAGLPALKHLALCNQFPRDEFARLAGRRPDLAAELEPVNGPVMAFGCKKCKQKTMYQTLGKGLPWLCGHCDRARLDKHVAEFRAVAAAARDAAAG